jgi:monofunctional biosynthetic peptidoglycan transglycosylase
VVDGANEVTERSATRPSDAEVRQHAHHRVPRHLRVKGFTPVEDAGLRGHAQDQPERDADCSEMPNDVAVLIAAEGTA